MDSLVAGQIRITWALPADEGGDPVTGYLVYLDEVLHYDARGVPTLNEFTFTSLNVAQTYTLGVSAVNDIGEGPQDTLMELAASVPMKLPSPLLESSTGDSLTVTISGSTFDGGAEVTHYAYRRDDGPATIFEDQISSTDAIHTFTWLTTAQFYRVQVAAINSLGQGAWSEHIGFFTTAAPSEVLNLRATHQSETQITIEWDEPSSSGGCPLTGYLGYLEDIEEPGFT